MNVVKLIPKAFALKPEVPSNGGIFFIPKLTTQVPLNLTTMFRSNKMHSVI